MDLNLFSFGATSESVLPLMIIAIGQSTTDYGENPYYFENFGV